MTGDRALLVAVPLRHLESAAGARATLPAGDVGDLDAATPGLTVVLMATDAGDAEVPAATWRATFVRRVPYAPGAEWPDGVPPTWAAERGAPPPPDAPPGSDEGSDDADCDDDRDDDWDDDEDWDDEEPEQAFLEVSGLGPLPRDEWVFANELVGKQARRGRSFRPRAPTLVSLPD